MIVYEYCKEHGDSIELGLQSIWRTDVENWACQHPECMCQNAGLVVNACSNPFSFPREQPLAFSVLAVHVQTT